MLLFNGNGYNVKGCNSFYAPTFKKLGHIGLALSVYPSVRLSVTLLGSCETREWRILGN